MIAERLAAAISAGELTSVSTICDEIELEVGVLGDDWPFVVHLLGYLINNELNAARFLWKRIPETVKQGNGELSAAWEITKKLWNGEYDGLYGLLQNGPWTEGNNGVATKPVVAQLAVSVREHVVGLVSRAFTTVTLSDVSVLLGLPESEALALTTQQLGWERDPSNDQILLVKHVPKTTEYSIGAKNLHQLTEYVVHLET